MVHTDAQSIALRAIRTILDAAAPIQLRIGEVEIDVKPEKLDQPKWPGNIPGLDEQVDGPWPRPVLLDCSWGTGSVTLRMDAARYKNRTSLAVSIDKPSQLLAWSTVSQWIGNAGDAEVAPFGIGVSVMKRKTGPLDTTNQLMTAKLHGLVEQAGLARIDKRVVLVGRVNLPEGTVEPGPAEGFRVALLTSLLKLPFFAGEDHPGIRDDPPFRIAAVPPESLGGGSDGQPLDRREEFARLYDEYSATYPVSRDGLRHQRLYLQSREEAHRNVQAILTQRSLVQSDRFDRGWDLLRSTYVADVELPENVIPLNSRGKARRVST